MSFAVYTHLEEKVEAIQSTPENKERIIEALSNEAENGLLSKLTMKYNSGTLCYDIVFRYKTATTQLTLNASDYLVKLNSTMFTVMSEKEFKQIYLPTEDDFYIPDAKRKTVFQALITIAKNHAIYNINSISDFVPEKLGKLLEKLQDWYNPVTNNFDLKLMHSGIIEPAGISVIVNALPVASFMNKDTTISLNFTNAVTAIVDDAVPNMFNLIGLQTLAGELTKISEEKKISGVDLSGEIDKGISAVAKSVSEPQWNTFVVNASLATGAPASAFKK